MPFNFLNQGQTDDAATRVSPIDTFIDPVSKIRVSNPGNLIDTDFEYGLQPTKWETVEIINNTPAFFSKSGDTTISDITGVTTNAGTREITVTTAFPHNLAVGIPIRVAGTKSITADGSYIINATPTPTTFTYLSRANEPDTISIFDLYTSIITGEFFQGSQISISDSEGITTDGVGPNSTLTVKTSNNHGFGPLTPFYFLNLNSTVSKEFEAQNSTSLSFDPTNSATAQSFDGSNTLLQTPIDLSNSATTSENQSTIQSTNATDATITVSIPLADQDNWSNIVLGSPLYYDVNIGSGFFQANPRGVVFIKDTSLVDAPNGTATFQVSELPDGDPLPILSNMTGFFQIADQARTFAGNNVNPETQIDLTVEIGEEFVFDGGNQGFDGDAVIDFEGNPPSNSSIINSYDGETISVFTNEAELDYYVGAMLLFETDGTVPTGLSNNTTYFVTSFQPGISSGLYDMTISELPGGDNITASAGDGERRFSKIGVSIDKDIVHIRDSNFEEDDMLEYTYPIDGTPGNFGADFEQKFYFVENVYDAHNYKLSEDAGFKPLTATGGDVITAINDQGRTWRVHTFNTVGTSNFVVSDVGQQDQGDFVEFLVIGGGGGGGNTRGGGGGGAGGFVEGTATVSAQSYSIVVGAGGAGGNVGNNGQNSSAFGSTAIGGGGGGAHDGNTAQDGGSGGGGGGGDDGNEGFPGNALQPNSASGGFGNDGGRGSTNTSGDFGAGGGGAGGPGQSAANGSRPGAGGPGRASTITGSEEFYAGGGGGEGTAGPNPAGGVGGGGAAPGGNGLPNTGSGGGGGEGDGGSGVVIVRYPITEVPIGGIVATGGSVQTNVNVSGAIYNIHAFSTVGTDTFTISSADKPEFAEVDVLVVAGGGGGGASSGGGGGGAGGVVFQEKLPVSTQAYQIVVGNGGSGGTEGSNGGNSSALGLVAIGGGGGGQGDSNTANDGGSGGGGGGSDTGSTGLAGSGLQPNSASGGFGNAGGRGSTNTSGDFGGGGGGAGAVGQAAVNGSRVGEGGIGLDYSAFFTSNYGENGYFGGGGGGGSNNSGSGNSRPGGLGGGGATNTAGQPATGGGGGAGGSASGSARDGGSGIVLIRYITGVVS